MVEPFLNLNGKCNEAIDFYEKVFDGQKKTIMRYKEAPPNPYYPIPDELKDLILYAEMNIKGTNVHFSDTQQNVVPGNMISMAITLASVEEVTSTFNQLKVEGEILMELEPNFFSPMYGWVKDKYGVGWQLICQRSTTSLFNTPCVRNANYLDKESFLYKWSPYSFFILPSLSYFYLVRAAAALIPSARGRE